MGSTRPFGLPDDDAPRLVLADFFEEQGDPGRARLIRRQIRQARLPAWDPVQVHLEVEALIQGPVLLQPGPKQVEGVWEEARRGVVDVLRFKSWELWREYGPARMAAHPVVALAIPRTEEEALVLPTGLQELVLPPLTVSQVRTLAQCPAMATIRRLEINQLNAEGLSVLVGSPTLEQLESLSLPSANLGFTGIEALCRSGWPLRELSISTTPWLHGIDDDGAMRLAEWGGLAGLRRLDLLGHPIGVAGLSAILGAATSLVDLRLQAGFEGPETAVLAFRGADGFSLECLELEGVEIGDAEAEALAGSVVLQTLKTLHVDDRETSMVRVFEMPWMDGLRVLRAALAVDGLTALLSRAPRALHTLDLNHGSISWLRNAWSTACQSGKLPALLRLDTFPDLTDDDLHALAKFGAFPNLIHLEWGQPRGSVTPSRQGTQQLLASEFGKRLSVLRSGYVDLDKPPWPDWVVARYGPKKKGDPKAP